MNARKSAICRFSLSSSRIWSKKNILQTITHLIQYTILEIQFWSVKCMTVTVGYAKMSKNISLLPIQATQAMTMDRLDENKPPHNAFKPLSANPEKWSNTLKCV